MLRNLNHQNVNSNYTHNKTSFKGLSHVMEVETLVENMIHRVKSPEILGANKDMLREKINGDKKILIPIIQEFRRVIIDPAQDILKRVAAADLLEEFGAKRVLKDISETHPEDQFIQKYVKPLSSDKSNLIISESGKILDLKV